MRKLNYNYNAYLLGSFDDGYFGVVQKQGDICVVF